jgi:MFS family permease
MPNGKDMPSAVNSAEVQEMTKETLTGLILVYFSVFMDFFGALVVVPLLPYLAEKFEIGSLELALMTTVYQLATVPAAFIVAKITEAWGTKYGIMYSIFGTSASVALQGLAGSYHVLLIARVAGGLTGSSIPVALTFIGMRVPKKDKPQYMSYIGVCLTSVVIFAPLISGALSSYGLGWPFVFGSVFAFVGGLLALVFLPNAQVPSKSKQGGRSLQQPLTAADGKEQTKPASGFKSLDKPLWALLWIEFLRTLPFSAFASLNGLFMMEKFSLTAQDYG